MLLLLGGAFLMCRSWIVRDEILIAKRTLFVAASDSGRIELAFASCSTATPYYTPYMMGLSRGVHSVYSRNVTVRMTSSMPGGGMLTRHHFGIEDSQLNYYGNLLPSSPQPLGPLPLMNDITEITFPTALLLCIAAIVPSIWLWKSRRQRLYREE